MSRIGKKTTSKIRKGRYHKLLSHRMSKIGQRMAKTGKGRNQTGVWKGQRTTKINNWQEHKGFKVHVWTTIQTSGGAWSAILESPIKPLPSVWIVWYLASGIWPEVRTVDRVYIFAEPQPRGEANIDEVNRAHRGPYHELNISRYSRTRGEHCTYTWKVGNESFLSTTVLCERLNRDAQCL